jgi:hypothetical protein
VSGGGWNAHHNAIARGGNDCDTWKFEWMLQPMSWWGLHENLNGALRNATFEAINSHSTTLATTCGCGIYTVVAT